MDILENERSFLLVKIAAGVHWGKLIILMDGFGKDMLLIFYNREVLENFAILCKENSEKLNKIQENSLKFRET